MKKFISLLVVLVCFLAAQSQVIIYSDCNFRGQSAILGPGNYYSSSQFRLADNTISSVYIPRGCRVELYSSVNMSGRQTVLTANNTCLPVLINNNTSSIRITYSNDNGNDLINPEGGVSVFTSCNFQGHSAFIPPGNYNSLNNIIGNDAISSLKVPAGMTVELFRDYNFTGASSGKITSSTPCLNISWNNNASSAKVYYNNGGWIPPTEPPVGNGGNITIYSGCSYRGSATNFSPSGYADLRYMLKNLPAGSIQIPAGLTVEFYSGVKFSGYLMGRYNNNQSCLSSEIQFNALSMRVYGSGTGGGNGGNTGVTFFSSCNYGGSASGIKEGRYASVFGQINPSSIRLSQGYTVELFTGNNFSGTSTGKITASNSCLGTWIRGKVKSFIVSYGSQGGNQPGNDVLFYSSCYYGGRSELITVGRYPTIFGRVNPSSIKIPQGFTVELFSKTNFSGTSTGKITSDNNCLGTWIKGRVGSFIIDYADNNSGGEHGGNGPFAVTIYSNCNFTGLEKDLQAGYYPRLTARGPGDVAVYPFSAKVPRGYKITLYTGENFSGASMVITSDNTCLPTAWRGRARSAIVARQ